MDSIGTNNGALENGATFAAGEVGQAFSFNGSNQFVTIPNYPGLTPTGSFSIEAWIYPEQTGNQAILSKWTDAQVSYIFYVTPGSGLGFAISDAAHESDEAFQTLNTADNLIVVSNWTHVAGVYDQSTGTRHVYINGVEVANRTQTPMTIFNGSSVVGIGAIPPGSWSPLNIPFGGLIDEVSFYNQARSATEVQAIYNAGSAGKCLPPLMISGQPASQTVPVGGVAIFNVTASGVHPLSYQWSLNGTNLAGATNSSLILTDVQASQAGTYAALVANRYGSALSSNAVLTVNASPVCVPSTSGLVDWWRAEGDATDAIGTNNGALENGATFAAGEVGQAFSFNGSNQFVTIPNNPGLTPTGSFSIEAWIYPEQTGNQAILSKWTDAQVSYIFYVTPGSGLGFAISDAAHESDEAFQTLNTADNLIVVSNWTHVTGVYDQNTGTRHIYINGVEVANRTQSPMTIFNGSSVVGIGAIPPGSSSPLNIPFGGLIDEVSFYNQALAATEVQAIYNAGSAGKCLPPLIISGQPASQSVTVGAVAIFSVTASGVQPFSYQWSFNGTNIAGATGSSLILTNVQSSQAGNYSVQVTNLSSSVTSSNASLTVIVPTCVPPPSGLVGWWAGESNALDALGISNGTLEGAAGYGPGEVGTAFSFDPASGTMIVPDSPSLRLTNQLTLEAWINTQRTNSSSPDQCIIAKVGGAAGNNGYALVLSANNLVGEFNTPGQAWPGTQIIAPLPIVTGTWNHVAFTYDQSAMKLYFNGQPVATNVIGPVAISASAANLHVSSEDNNNAYFAGLIDEPSVYNRALSASQVAGIYNAGTAGKCPIPTPPFIASQPVNQAITSGGTATFGVVAGGAATLNYQWSFNGASLAGATGSSLALTNVQMSQAGNYSVTVTNLYGSTTSSNALLTVNPAPSVIQAASINATSGIVVVPIILLSQGNENALQFSVDFDPTLLMFTGATLGSGVTNGSLLDNLNQISSGKLGLLISLPTDASFSAGTQQLAEISFFVAPISNTIVSAISFGDQPTLRQVSSPLPSILPASYVAGNITIPPLGIEADVFPVPNGDGVVSASDVVQMGRFVAGVDVITNASEFQRADCAPRATLGDGLLTVADWVQAGRYAAALDPLVAAGGPTQPQGGGGNQALKSGPRIATGRILFLPPATVQAGQAFQLPVQLASQGDENGLEFSLDFDPTLLGYVSTAAGSGASMRVNTNSTASGRLGIVMILPTGSTFGGATQQVATVTFNVAANAHGSSSINFGTQPLLQQVVSATAVDLPTSYVNDLLAITPIASPTLDVAVAHGQLMLSWPTSASGFVLESSANVASPSWSSVSATQVTNSTAVVVTVPASATQNFYRLRHP